MNALLYVRVSTDEQKIHGISIQAQIENLTAYCESHGYKIKGIYNDAGKSGGSMDKRSELQRMMREAETGDIILFTKMDRLSRNIRDGLNLMYEMQERGVSFYAIDNKFGANSSPQDKAMMHMSLTFGQLERDMDGERIRDVMKNKKERHEALSGSVPLGYKIENKHIVEDPETSDLARFIFKRYHECGVIQQVYKEVNVRCGYVVRDVAAYKFILRNRMYIGEKHGIPGYCDSIIDPVLFEQVQEDLKTRTIKATKTGKVYLFSRLVVCPCCGRKLYAHGYTNSDYVYYNCSTRSPVDNRASCHFKQIKEETLEQQLLDSLQAFASSEALKFKSQKKDIKKYQTKINKLNQKKERLKDLYVDLEISKDDYKSRASSIDSEIVELQKLCRSVDTSGLEGLAAVDPRGMYDGLNKESKREFWHRVLESITVDKEGRLVGVSFCK